MCISASPKASPTPPPPVPSPAPVPNKVANKQETDAARALERQRAALASGQKDAINTTAQGDTTTANVKKQTLG
jgi:hypothetical protein